MSKLMIALFVAAGLGVAGSAAAQMTSPIGASMPMSKESHAMAKANAEAQYHIDKDSCSSMRGNANDNCVAQAKGKETVAKAEADAALAKGKADNKVDRVVADTRKDAAAKQANTSRGADVDKRDAEYQVAIEKCDALTGPTKESCVSSAKMQYGKS